jgi:hypothetical protein
MRCVRSCEPLVYVFARNFLAWDLTGPSVLYRPRTRPERPAEGKGERQCSHSYMHTHLRACRVPIPIIPLPCVEIIDVVPAPAPILTVAALPPPLYSEAIPGIKWLQSVPVTPTFSNIPVGSSTCPNSVVAVCIVSRGSMKRAGARAGRSTRAHPQLSAPSHSAQRGPVLSEGLGVLQAGCKPAPRSCTQWVQQTVDKTVCCAQDPSRTARICPDSRRSLLVHTARSLTGLTHT